MNIWTHYWFQSQLFTLSVGGISESEHFIWKYEIISGFDLSCSLYLKRGVYLNLKTIWKYELISGFWSQLFTSSEKGGISESENFIWKYELISGFGLSCSPHLNWEVYLNVNTYIYIYRSAKFGVVVFKASMLDWLGGPSATGIYALFCH